MRYSKKVAKAIEKAIPCARIGVAVAGLEVPHAHVHLIPMDSIGDIDFGKPKLQLTSEELAAVAQLIRTQF